MTVTIEHRRSAELEELERAGRIVRNRAGLLLVGNKVFLAFGATIGEDNTTDFHGFIIGVDVTDPAHPRLLPHVFCSTPTMDGAGIWMGGGGPASDGSSIYALTGNGAYSFKGDIVNPQTSILDAPRSGNGSWAINSGGR